MKVTYLSKLFTPSIKKLPKESKTISKSQQLLTYYGLISPSGNGTYTIMPILQRSLDKLIHIINTHMYNIDAQKVTMPTLGRSNIWKISGRWESMKPEMFILLDKDQNDLCLQPTHEEEVTSLLTSFPLLNSHQLPILLYQVGPKFRNETAPKSGLLRCREFLMKDLYSFDRDHDSATTTYHRVLNQYHNIFNDLGLKYMCVDADCGTMGGLLSHEFHIESEVGEDNVLRCDSCGNGFNEELLKTSHSHSARSCPKEQCPGNLSFHKAIEIGHCFLLGEKYSKAFDLHYYTTGDKRYIMMGCYGIGVTRLLSTCVEVLSSDNEIRWPRKVVPYRVAVLLQKDGAHDRPSSELTRSIIDGLGRKFVDSGLCISDIMVDDRQVTIGKKLANASCLGIPWAVVVKDKDILEVLDVYSNRTRHLSIEECAVIISNDQNDVECNVAVKI